MILYPKTGAYGINLLVRIHGSAVYRGFIPALLSTILMLIAVIVFDLPLGDRTVKYNWTNHPYAIGVLVAFFTFLITFRANFAYGRYWEGASAVHQMLSKWLDAAIQLAAFHMQSSYYDGSMPPTFGEHVAGRNATRERENNQGQLTKAEIEASLADLAAREASGGMLHYLRKKRTQLKRMVSSHHTDDSEELSIIRRSFHDVKKAIAIKDRKTLTAHIPVPHVKGRPSLPKLASEAKLNGGLVHEEPSLFLQELAHLMSLMSAVAMSTLRHDLEGAESPLVEYRPGEKWPPVDPDKLSDAKRIELHEEFAFERLIMFFLGYDRSDRHRTLYNAVRPFPVLGGISDSEIEELSAARGPYAKVVLCSMWLQEFLSREYKAGSTGKTAPPILSRLYQFISDGMIGYNHARKIAQIPFPFPLVQLTTIYILVVMFVFPVLYYSWVSYLWLGCVINFSTVLCFVGLHEVAREIEQPFRNAPNDIPLITFQAQFNEALVTMYAGYHPDSYWYHSHSE